MVFCIDSHIFVWGIKKQASDHELHRIDEARDFLQWIDRNDHTLMVPSVVIAECLSQEPIESHASILKIVYETCMVVNFDERAAMKYAEILNQDKWKAAKEKAKQNGIARELMKIDYQIVACALANGANRIYSYDEGLRKFADGLIDVQPMPAISKQTEMFSTNAIQEFDFDTRFWEGNKVVPLKKQLEDEGQAEE